MRSIFIFLIATLFSTTLIAQSIGVGTNNPHPSAQLDVSSTNKGFLPPRMTAVQRDSIVSPAAGLIVYCTNCDTAGQMQYFNGNTWRNMMGAPAALPPIGQPYRGGILIGVLQPGDPGYDPNMPHGTIMAPTNQSEGIQWYNGTFVTTNASGVNFGTGKTNTDNIIAIQGAGSYAARLCYDLDLNGYDDWYLPSQNELVMVAAHVGLANAGDYWSSTESAMANSPFTAVAVFALIGDYSEPSKSELLKVRAIRSF